MLRQVPPPGPVHLALSGGGIRAALFSAGALLAVAEAEQDHSEPGFLARYHGAGPVRVESTTGVSGSSLLLGRLLLQESTVAPSDVVPRLRRETALLWQYGFRRRWPGALLLATIWSLGILLGFFTLTRWDAANHQLLFQPNSPLLDWFEQPRFWPEAVSVATLAALMLALWRRMAPFVLDIRHGSFTWRPFPRLRGLWSQQRWQGEDRDRHQTALAPGSNVRFVTTNLADQTSYQHDPWNPPATTFGRASLHDLAKASAAFPIYSSGVRLDGAPHVDGGVLDNLGVSHGLTEPTGWVLSVDCSLPGDTIAPGASDRTFRQTAARAAGYLVVVLGAAALAALAIVQWLPTEWHQTALALLTLAVLIAGLRPILGSLVAELRLTTGEMANEWTALATMQAQQRDYLYTHLVVNDRPFRVVRLVDGRHFSQPRSRARHDLTTKLSPLAPDSGREVIREGYRGTCRALGRVETELTIQWINDLRPPLLRRLVERLGLGRVARALRRVVVMPV